MEPGIKRSPALEQFVSMAEQAFSSLPMAAYITDSEGTLVYCNDAAVKFAGRAPKIGDDKYCICWRAYDIDGSVIAPEDGPMAMSLREGKNIRGVMAIAERPDGSRQAFMPFPCVLRDDGGNVIGAFNAFYPLNDKAQAAVLAGPDWGGGPTMD